MLVLKMCFRLQAFFLFGYKFCLNKINIVLEMVHQNLPRHCQDCSKFIKSFSIRMSQGPRSLPKWLQTQEIDFNLFVTF